MIGGYCSLNYRLLQRVRAARAPATVAWVRRTVAVPAASTTVPSSDRRLTYFLVIVQIIYSLKVFSIKQPHVRAYMEWLTLSILDPGILISSSVRSGPDDGAGK